MSYVEDRTCSWFVSTISDINAGTTAALLQCERALGERLYARGGF